MNDKKKKIIFTLIVAIAIIILISVGSTFAYFSATISSDPDAISVTSAEFQLNLIEDSSLTKSNVIPSIEDYVDITATRVDENGKHLKPYEENGETITDGTTCIDDNLNEICSIYTFTIQNPMTTTDLPLYITLNTGINTFENLYFKVFDENQEEVIGATHLIDDREYEVDEDGNKVYAENAKISPVVLTNINKTLPRATDDKTPSEVTYSIVLWIMETGDVQNDEDGGKGFAGTLFVSASGPDGKGITGTLVASGVE